jgi:DNA-binding transcriptional LysR family regulator
MNLANQKYMLLKPHWFKAFMAVCEYRTLSVAAQHSAQSVSVVSEHLKFIKDSLGKEVFTRVGGTYEVTDTGKELNSYIRKIMDISSDFHGRVASEDHAMEGMIRYAIPHSCIQSPHFSRLIQRHRDYSGVELTVELCPTEVAISSILQGRFDFGFVTDRVNHPNLEYIQFCEEEYVFVSSEEIELSSLSVESLASYKYIDYPGMNVCFDLWIRHHYPTEKMLSAKSLYHSGEINEIVSAIRMVVGGLGVSVFPRHVVEDYLQSGVLCEVSPEKYSPVMNSIYITRLKDVVPSSRVKAVIQWFRDVLPEYQ